MNEEYLNNPEETSVMVNTINEGETLAETGFPVENMNEENIGVPNIEMSPDQVEAIGEDVEVIEELHGDAEIIADIASLEGASLEARQAAIANALFVGDEETIATNEEFEAKAKTRGLEFTDWVSTKGRKWLAVLALAIGAGAMAPAANAGGIQDFNRFFNKGTGSQVIKTIDNTARAYEQLGVLNNKQETLRTQINQIDEQIQLLLARSTVTQEVGAVQNEVGSAVRPMEAEAKFEAAKANLELQKAQVKSRFANIANPTQTDIAKYNVAMSNIKVKEVQLEAKYEVESARQSGQGTVNSVQLEMKGSNVDAQVQRLRHKQEQLEGQIRLIEIQKVRLGQRTLNSVTPR